MKQESGVLEVQRRSRWRTSKKKKKWHERNRNENDGMVG